MVQLQFLMLNFMSVTVVLRMVIACPDGCLCDDKFQVNCAGLGLLYVPHDGIENHTKSLILDDNFISDLNDGSFTTLWPWLRKLSLANNQLERISNRCFSNLPRLRSLDLSGNLFSDAPSFLSQNLHSLRKLDLSRNALMYLAADTFMELPKLHELYLDGNNIQTIEEGVFSNVPSLVKISLKENSIGVDPIGWFANTAAEEVDLSYNQIPLTSNISAWFGGNDNLNLMSLIFQSNNITALPRGIFRELKNLRVLDLLGNQLHTIGQFSFYGLEGLTELILDDNLLTEIHGGSLLGLPHLQRLSLDGNELKSLPGGLLNSATSLNVFRAAFNALNDISVVTESNSVGQLSELVLTSNQISNLTISDHLSGLTVLKVGMNLLSTFPDIQKAISLQVIELSINEIDKVPGSAFEYNKDLREIYLDQNHLVSLDYEIFSNLSNLEILTLAGNSWWCDCRLVWMQDLMWSQDQPLWAANLMEDIICSHPPALKDESLQFSSLKKLMDQCPIFRLAVALPVLLGLWLLIALVVLGRFWTARFHESCSFTKYKRSNKQYSSRMLRRRKRGVIGIAIPMAGTHYQKVEDESDASEEPIRKNGWPTGKTDVYRETRV